MGEMKKAKLREVLGLMIGEASMLWSETPKGIFESTKGIELLESTLSDIIALDIHDIIKCDQENRLLKSKLEKSKEKLQSILDEKWILLKSDQDRLLNKVSEALKEIEGL